MKPSKSNGNSSGEDATERNHSLPQTEPGTTKDDLIKFRLYVSGNCPNSIEAEFNLRTLCCEHLKQRHEIEIVDVKRDPDRALADGVFLTPLLMKLSPGPLKIIGNLSVFEPIMQALGLSSGLSPKPREAQDTSQVEGRYNIKPANGSGGPVDTQGKA